VAHLCPIDKNTFIETAPHQDGNVTSQDKVGDADEPRSCQKNALNGKTQPPVTPIV